jgi:hypothetical protein
MTCERVQVDLSRAMDEGVELSSGSQRHLAVCAECAEFRETSADIGRRYGLRVRTGIERMRRLEPPRPRLSARKPWLAPLAAALLLCWWSAEPVGTARPAAPVAVAPPVRIWPVDEAGLSFISVRDVLPLRLHDEFLPEPPAVSEISLPRDLRF